MADADQPAIDAAAKQHFAMAPERAHPERAHPQRAHEELTAKSRAGLPADNDDDDAGTRRAAHYAKTVAYRESVSSDEAQILRERAAWLRSLDRKYGIGR